MPKLNPFTGQFDYTGLSQTAADALYLKLTAANQTLTGNLAITGTLGATELYAGDRAGGEYIKLSLGGGDSYSPKFYAPGFEFYTNGSYSQPAGRVGVVSYDDAADALITYSDSIGGGIGLYGTGGLDQGLGLGYYDGGLYSSTLVLPWNSGAWAEVDIYGKLAVTDTITGNSSVQLLDTAGLILKGATYKITLNGTTGTSDKIITIPNLTGTMALTGVAQNWATTGTLATGNITMTGTKLKIIGTRTSGVAVTESGGGTILDYGVNYDQLGGRDAAAAGGLFRIDTRTGYYLAEFFNIIYRAAGGTEAVIFKCSTTGNIVTVGSITAATGFGCNGHTPQLSVTASADATDLATAITLVNNLKATLIANGVAA